MPPRRTKEWAGPAEAARAAYGHPRASTASERLAYGQLAAAAPAMRLEMRVAERRILSSVQVVG